MLTDETGRIGELQKRLDAAEGELGSVKQVLEAKEVDLNEKMHEQGRLEFALGSARLTIARAERVLQDFAERVFTEYTSLVHAQASSYHDLLNAVLSGAQSREEYLGGYRVRVSEDHHSLQIGGANSDEECGISKPRLKTMVMYSRFLRHLMLLSFVYPFLVIIVGLVPNKLGILLHFCY